MKVTNRATAITLISVLIIIATVVVVLIVRSQDPQVLQSRADLAEKSAMEWEAREAFYDRLPTILVSTGYTILGSALGIGLLFLMVSLALQVSTSAFLKVTKHGVGLYKKDGDREQKTYLASPNTVVAAHLERLTDTANPDADGFSGRLPPPTGRGTPIPITSKPVSGTADAKRAKQPGGTAPRAHTLTDRNTDSDYSTSTPGNGNGGGGAKGKRVVL